MEEGSIASHPSIDPLDEKDPLIHWIPLRLKAWGTKLIVIAHRCVHNMGKHRSQAKLHNIPQDTCKTPADNTKGVLGPTVENSLEVCLGYVRCILPYRATNYRNYWYLAGMHLLSCAVQIGGISRQLVQPTVREAELEVA